MSDEAQENPEDVDVEALLAQINANFEDTDELPQNDGADLAPQQSLDDLQGFEDKQIMIVRETAQKEEEEFDPILDILSKIEIRNSLLTEKEFQEHQIDSLEKEQIQFDQKTIHLIQHPQFSMQTLAANIKARFDNYQNKIVTNQRDIISKVTDIKNQSNKLLNSQQTKETTFSKLKVSDVNLKKKHLQYLDIQCYKTKGYVLTMIERLEVIESSLDRMAEYHVKKKLKEMEEKVSQIEQHK